MMKVRQVRFSQSVWIDGRMEVSLNTDLAHNTHLTMEFDEASGLMKIVGKKDTVYVPLTNIGSFYPPKEDKIDAVVDTPKPVEPRRRGRPPRQEKAFNVAESIDRDASEEDED
jgi:hypothetical protein